jgi:hypothetical protein
MRTIIVLSLLFAFVPGVYAAKSRTVYLNDTDMTQVRIMPGRSTILNFPIRPTKVILGNQGSFTVEFVENDLALNALRSQAQGNLFAYMEGRRFAFDLRTVVGGGDEIVLVRDASERPARKPPRGKHE